MTFDICFRYHNYQELCQLQTPVISLSVLSKINISIVIVILTQLIPSFNLFSYDMYILVFI